MDNPTVILGYSRSKGQYRVDEIRGDMATVSYQRTIGVPDQDGPRRRLAPGGRSKQPGDSDASDSPSIHD